MNKVYRHREKERGGWGGEQVSERSRERKKKVRNKKENIRQTKWEIEIKPQTNKVRHKNVN